MQGLLTKFSYLKCGVLPLILLYLSAEQHLGTIWRELAQLYDMFVSFYIEKKILPTNKIISIKQITKSCMSII